MALGSALTCALAAAPAALSQPLQLSRQPSGDDIARRTLRADFAWEGARTRARMVLIGANGQRKERSMEVVARRKDGAVQSLVRFFAPQEVAGTAFLVREQPDGSSEQYVYLAGLKRTRRIAGREREGSFMGSDFSYADMQDVGEASSEHQRLSDEPIGKDDCYVVETRIKPGSGSPYSRTISWVRKSDFVALRTRLFDPKGQLVKTLYIRRVRLLEGKPVVVEARMQSTNGHATELIIDAIERSDALDDSLFSPATLDKF